MKKQRHLMVTVFAISGEEILKADCRLIYDGHTAQRGPKVHCLKAVIAVETGLNMWEFSLMCGDRLLQDRDNIFCPRMAMRRDDRHQMTLQMLLFKVDTSHVTMRRFPMQWIHDTTTFVFLGLAKQLCSRYGEVVEIVDVSDQHRGQDDDRDGERTLEVKYLHAESGIFAMRGLSGQDMRSSREKRRVGGAPPGKEQKLVCLITGSPVVIEHCDCDDGADCRAMCRIVWRRPPPGAHPL